MTDLLIYGIMSTAELSPVRAVATRSENNRETFSTTRTTTTFVCSSELILYFKICVSRFSDQNVIKLMFFVRLFCLFLFVKINMCKWASYPSNCVVNRHVIVIERKL